MVCCATQSYSAAAILQASMFSSSSSDGAGSSQNMTKHWLLLRWIVERQLYEPWLYNISFCIECRTGSRCLACLCFLLGQGFWSKMQTNALGNFWGHTMLVFTHCDLDGEALERQVLAAHLNSPEIYHIHSELLAACVNGTSKGKCVQSNEGPIRTTFLETLVGKNWSLGWNIVRVISNNGRTFLGGQESPLRWRFRWDRQHWRKRSTPSCAECSNTCLACTT